MWLLTAIGPVHGQSKFTFALSQKRQYSVGRSDDCDVRFATPRIRLKEGSLILGDWDPTQPKQPPQLRWRPEPKKSGARSSILTLDIKDPEDTGSTDKGDYAVTPVDADACEIYSGVQGVELPDGCWFIAEWRELSLQLDRMKDESDDVRDLLRQYCIAWTQTFDLANRPTYVLSPTLKANADCNYAVCFAIRILLPSFLEALLSRLKSCWKKMADHQDSFMLPNEEDPIYQPELDTALPASRKDKEKWAPDPRRETLFQGWTIMGLRGKTQSAEKRYLMAMGADYQDIDVVSDPVNSSQDFADRLKTWLTYVDANGGRDTAIVVWFMPVKAGLAKRGIDYTSVIQSTCHRLGIYHTNGGVLWGSVNKGGVKAYMSAVASNLPQKSPAKRASEPAVEAQLSEPARSMEAQAVAPRAGSSRRPDAVPSTFPQETEPRPSRSPSPVDRTSRPIRRARQTSTSPGEKTPEPELPATVTKKPLRRRARKAALEIPESPPDSREYTPQEPSQASQPLFSQPDYVQDSMPQATQATAFAPQPTQTQSMVQDSVMPSQSVSQFGTGRSGRLKRRAGGGTPSLIQEIADTSINIERDLKAEEQAASIRELYEQTKAGSFAPHHVSKRPRLATVESQDSSLSRGDEPMSVDGESLSSATTVLGKNARSRRPPSPELVVPPPAQRTRTLRSPSEDEEEEALEVRSAPAKSQRLADKSAAKPSGPTKDEAFLQAINKSTKSRKAVDELDKVFNQLRIPKPTGGSLLVKANEWEASHSDYAILNDMDDDLRGNFIQIVKKDLFRKDQGKDRTAERVDDGRPNFKKFKKKSVVRRQPMQLVLAGPTAQDGEMGEPYWPTQVVKNGRGKAQQSQFAMEVDTEDMPLLPRSRKRLLATQVSQDDDDLPPSTVTQRAGRIQDSQPQTQTPQVGISHRKTRAASVVSEADSVATNTSAATSTRARSTRAGTSTRSTRTSSKQPVVLEDSEEEGVDWGASTKTRGTRSGRTVASSAIISHDGPPGTTTNDADTAMLPPSTAATKSRRTQPSTPASAVLGGRRKLLPADDDDSMAFRGLGKKRRIG
ncbi:hypothetical protein IAU60_000152 [Kwoniella sp. DSM 27419]